MSTTIFTLNNVLVQVILPKDFKIVQVNARKKNLPYDNYANAGFFAKTSNTSVIPVGNLMIDGKVITDAKSQATWLNTAKHKLSTVIVNRDNTLELRSVDDLHSLKNAKYAISGIPVLRNGWNVIKELKSEGYFGNECYGTWHTFLGIRYDKLILVGAHCSYGRIPYLIDSLGLNDSIKLDGGGSFIMKSGDLCNATSENRIIDNIITW